MDAEFKIKPSELNAELLKKLKYILTGKDEYSVTIKIEKQNINHLVVKETPELYTSRILKADEDIKSGKGKVFTYEEFDEFAATLLQTK